MAGSIISQQLLTFVPQPGTSFLGNPMATGSQVFAPKQSVSIRFGDPRTGIITLPTNTRLDRVLAARTVRAPLVRPQESALRRQYEGGLVSVSDQQVSSGPVMVRTQDVAQRFRTVVPTALPVVKEEAQQAVRTPSLLARGLSLAKSVSSSISSLGHKAASVITFSVTSAVTRLAAAKTVYEESPWAISEAEIEEALATPEQVVEAVENITPDAVDVVPVTEVIETSTTLAETIMSYYHALDPQTIAVVQGLGVSVVGGLALFFGGKYLIKRAATHLSPLRKVAEARAQLAKVRREAQRQHEESELQLRELQQQLEDAKAQASSNSLETIKKTFEPLLKRTSHILLLDLLISEMKDPPAEVEALKISLSLHGEFFVFPHLGLFGIKEDRFNSIGFGKDLNHMERVLTHFGDGDGGSEEEAGEQVLMQAIVGELNKRLQKGRHYQRVLRALDDLDRFHIIHATPHRARQIKDTIDIARANVKEELARYGINDNEFSERTNSLLRRVVLMVGTSVSTSRLPAEERPAFNAVLDRLQEAINRRDAIHDQGLADALAHNIEELPGILQKDRFQTGVAEADLLITEHRLKIYFANKLGRVLRDLDANLRTNIELYQAKDAYVSLQNVYDNLRVIQGQIYSDQTKAEIDRLLQMISVAQLYIFHRCNEGDLFRTPVGFTPTVKETKAAKLFKKMETDIPIWVSEIEESELSLIGIPADRHGTLEANISILKAQLTTLRTSMSHGNDALVEAKLSELSVLENQVAGKAQKVFEEGTTVGVFVDDTWQEFIVGTSTTVLPEGTLIWQDGLIVGQVSEKEPQKFLKAFTPFKYWSPDDQTVVVKQGAIENMMTVNSDGVIVTDDDIEQPLVSSGVFTLNSFDKDTEIGLVINGRPYVNQEGLERLLEDNDDLHPGIKKVLEANVAEYEQLDTGIELDSTMTIEPALSADESLGTDTTIEADPIAGAEGEEPPITGSPIK